MYAFSINEEEWYSEDQHGNEATTEAEAIACAISYAAFCSEEGLKLGDFIWIGPKIPHTVKEFISAEDLIEQANERAGDECGECVEDWPAISMEKMAELARLLSDFIETNAPCRFWTVEEIMKHEITAEDMAGFNPAKE
jgi:hypothetical protein